MNNDSSFVIFGFIMGALVVVLLWFAISPDYKIPAIEAGCGQFNPQTGKFEWLHIRNKNE